MKIYILTYLAVASICQAFYLRKELKRFNSTHGQTRGWQIFKELVYNNPSLQNVKKKVWNWYTIAFVGVPFFILLSAVTFPSTLGAIIRKAIFGKSKAEKEDDEFERMARSEAGWNERRKGERLEINLDENNNPVKE